MLQSKKIFEAGQRVEIFIKSAKEKDAVCYSSRVEELNDKYIAVAMPMHKAVPVMLEKNTEFTGKVFAKGVPYEFRSIYIGKQPGQVPTWLITYPAEMRKIQLREFVRIPVRIPIQVTVPPEDINTVSQEEAEPEVYDTVTKDLSGGGLRFLLFKCLVTGTKVNIKMVLPADDDEEEEKSIDVKAMVMRCEEQETEGKKKVFLIGVKFLNLMESQRKIIIKLVYDQQIEWRKRGLQ